MGFPCFHFILFAATTLLLHLSPSILVSAAFECEDLPIKHCAFAVSSYGRRCVLEKYVVTARDVEYKCQTSDIMAEIGEMIESEGCVNACGLQKMSVGISTDALAERDITRKICSSACRDYCPNIIDLYTELAVGEGFDLEALCESMASRPRKMMAGSYYSLPVSAATENKPINTTIVRKNAVQFFHEVLSPRPTYYTDNDRVGYTNVVKHELPLPILSNYGHRPEAAMNIP